MVISLTLGVDESMTRGTTTRGPHYSQGACADQQPPMKSGIVIGLTAERIVQDPRTISILRFFQALG